MMKRFLNITLLTGLMLAFACWTAPAQAQDYGDEEGEKMEMEKMTETTVVDLIANDERLSTLATVLEAAGLVEALEGEGPFTVFAPTNDAFGDIPEDELTELLEKENRDELAEILTYHVVPGVLTTETIRQWQLPQKRTTLNGAPLTFTDGELVVLVDDAEILNPDIEASNGVIHVIGNVMRPATMETSQ